MRYTTTVTGIALIVMLFIDPGELSSPPYAADLPDGGKAMCVVSAMRDDDYRFTFLSHTPRGELHLIEHLACSSGGCATWLVLCDQTGAPQTVLATIGELRFEPVADSFPAVHRRRHLGNDRMSDARFDWNGERYVLTENHVVHRIDGFECTGEWACADAAHEALRDNRVDRAVRIWQQVHGVNWI